VKIKLVIFSLLAVSGLWGSDRSQSVAMQGEEGLRKAFVHCIDNRSYAIDRFKRPITVCCFTETNNKDEIHNLTKKVIDNECQNVAVNFSKFANVYLHSGAHTTIKNVDGNQWIDKDYTDRRLTMCMIYNITSNNMQQDIEILNKLIDQNKETPLLITGTRSDFIAVFKELETNTKSFNSELAGELVTLSKELVLNEIDKMLERGPSLENLLESSKELHFESKALQSNNNKSKPGYFSITTLKNFFTNRWVIAGGFSLAALIVYYYKLVR